MATFKKTSTRKPAKKAKAKAGAGSAAQAERLGKSISESAQQIWLAGMGAFKRTQAEGSKLFESLVRDGLSLEQSVRKLTGTRADAMRGAVETGVDQARERASDTWDRLEKVFEERVQRALVKLGVPGRDDLNALSNRVERLTNEVRKLAEPAAAAATPRKTAARKPAARKAPAKPKAAAAPARKPAKKPAARKSAARAGTTASAD